MSRKIQVTAGIAAILGLFGTGLATGSGVQAAKAPVGQGFTLVPADLAFILKQIKIAERHSAAIAGTLGATQEANPDPVSDPEYCAALLAHGHAPDGHELTHPVTPFEYPDQVPDALTSYGLRTVDGGCNNLVQADMIAPDNVTTVINPNTTRKVSKAQSAQADQPFPRLAKDDHRPAENGTAFGGANPTSYAQLGGHTPPLTPAQSADNVVVDSQPRVISNLIVDQTSTNPAAIAAAHLPVRTQGNPESAFPCTTQPDQTAIPPVAGVPAGCTPAHQTLFIPNVTTDVGLSPPYNSLFTFFGQFFDHGVDQTVKSGGTVFVPLRADDPLVAGPDHDFTTTGDNLPASQRFIVLTRAQNQPGPDGRFGTSDDTQNPNNTDTPWVDQSQTYTSHPSHQVFLREYTLDGTHPVSTGKLLGGLPAGQTYPGSPDGTLGIGTWKAVKLQAETLLGLHLVDANVTNIPMLATDPYGKFIPGPLRGLPQYVTKGPDDIAGTPDDVMVEGNIASPVPVPANAVFFDTPFLTDIAHNADPSGGLTPDADDQPSADFQNQPGGTYDDELLNSHFICGDGRCNENIALSTIHQIFHSEHDRLVDYIKGVLTGDAGTATGALALPEWKPGADASANGGWNGERLFQAARFVTEMEYQHLVFEEFARKVQPAVRPFHLFTPDINPAIPQEFAAAVYRFGHSMLDDDVARSVVDPVTNATTDNSLPLLTAFLNPPEFFNNGAGGFYDAEQAAGAVVMGSSDQIGNELDEFINDTLRNNLLGLPLDLATLNLTRARDVGIPPLNEVRREIHARTNDGQLAPYTSWSDYGQHLKHPESLINFIAAYGTHPTIRDSGPDGNLGTADDVTTLAAKRAAATAIVNGSAVTGDSADFMFSTGAWASPPADAPNAGVTTTGLDNVDLWVGGLAEITNLFGGLLGSTFNYVFQTSLENLQDGDRLYYLARTPGMNLRTQLEGNSFSELIERNTVGTQTLKADAFATADCKFNLATIAGPADGTANGNFDPTPFITGPGTLNDDPSTTDCNENRLLLQKPDGTIQYRQVNSIDPVGINGQSVYNGTPGVDRVFGGNDNDTFWGNLGNDIIEGNGGDDFILGGDGDDIETDLSGADVLKGGPGSDALDGGIGDDIFMGGDGSDFINGGQNDNESFAGPGNDYIIAGAGADAVFGDDGDDWIEGGSGQDLLQGDHGAPFFDDPSQAAPGNDIFIGQVGENDYDAEGGDDLMAQNAAIDRNAGAAGFDWAYHQYDTIAGNDDLMINQVLATTSLPIQLVVNRDRWQETEAISGDKFNDEMHGDGLERVVGPGGFAGCDALDPAGVARIAGLDALLTPHAGTESPTPGKFPSSLAAIVAASQMKYCPLRGFGGTAGVLDSGKVWAQGNILIGGGGNDLIEGRDNDDIIDGDHRLTTRISVHANLDGTGAEIASTDMMEHKATSGSFGLGATPTMTLQQAVFSGIVRPSQLVPVREIVTQSGAAMGSTPDLHLPGDCVAGNTSPTAVNFGPVPGPLSTNCDTSLYTLSPDNYTVTVNADRSVSVADNASVAAADLFGGGDGVDTLWNVEVLRFCVANDAVTKACSATVNRLVSSFATGVPTIASVGLSAAALAFITAAGTLSTEQTITVTNTGTAALIVSNVALAGTGASQFLLVGDTCTGTPVAPAGTCTVKVQFAPSAAGSASASLVITSNAAGSPSSVALSGTATAALTAPGAPTIGTASAGSASATAHWTAPASNGGSAITGYSVRVVNSAGTTQIGALRTAPAGSTSLLVTGLANGTAVRFQVRAINAVGSSALSGLSNIVTPVATAAVPGAPTIKSPSKGPNGGAITATANWTPGNTGGSPITSYKVYAMTMSSNAANATVTATQVAIAPGTARAVTFTFTQTNLNVRFQVEANNAVGTGPKSAMSNNIGPR